MKLALRTKSEKLKLQDRFLTQDLYIILGWTFADCAENIISKIVVQVIKPTTWFRSSIPCSQPATGKDLDTLLFRGNMWHSACPSYSTHPDYIPQIY